MTDAERFAALFRGLDRAYGVYEIKKNGLAGEKVKGQAKTLQKEVTLELYQRHLEGKSSLGIIPIRDDSTCLFGAIDVDIYKNFDIKEFSKKVYISGLPFIPCRTKSGGVHLYLFLEKPVKASVLKSWLVNASIALDLDGSEIFPKQKKLADPTALGSWINLPYFNAKNTDRFAIINGKQLDFKAFLDYAEKNKPKNLELPKEPEKDLEDAPPCIQRLCAEGIVAGKKNNSLLNLGIFLKKKYPEIWQDKLKEANKLYCNPPAEAQTIKNVIQPLTRKNYFYTCAMTPIVDLCDKSACKKMAFGIGNTPIVTIGDLVKLATDPPIWVLDVDGDKLELSSDELLEQNKFRRACLEKIMKLPHKMKGEDWDELIRQKLEDAVTIDAPKDAGPEGQFLRLVEDFTMNRQLAKVKDEMLMGKPWSNGEGLIYFRSGDLLRYLDNNKFRDFKPKKMWAVLRQIGAVYETIRLKGKPVKIWGIPEFNRQEEPFDIPETEKGEY